MGIVAASSVVGAASGFATSKVVNLANTPQDEGNSTPELTTVEVQPATNNTDAEVVVVEQQETEVQEQQNTGGSTTAENPAEHPEVIVEQEQTVEVEVIDEDIVNPYEEIEEIEVVYGGPPIADEDTDIDIESDVYGGPVDDIYNPLGDELDIDIDPGLPDVLPSDIDM